MFLNEDDPYILFDAWMKEAEKSEPNDPNAFSVATSDHLDNQMLEWSFSKE